MKSSQVITVACIVVLALYLTVGLATAQGPEPQGALSAVEVMGTAFTYQGRLFERGMPASGVYDFEFKLYTADTGGAQVGSTVVLEDILVRNGYFAVALDFGRVFTGQKLWLEKGVRPGNRLGPFTALGPRQPLLAVPYALALPGLWTQENPTSPNLVGGFGGNMLGAGVVGATIGGGGASSAENRATGNYSTVGGGLGNVAGGAEATVAGGSANRSMGSTATVGGGSGNQATGLASTVAGGAANTASGEHATVSGGSSNQATGAHSAVGGGWENSASGTLSVVGGGQRNLAAAPYATVSGGSGNQATEAPFGVIGGGEANRTLSDRATVGGGAQNTASGSSSTVAGGFANRAEGPMATVGGGENNRVVGERATVSGGYNNNADGDWSTVAGGGENKTLEDLATVGGGRQNIASGTASTIGGGFANRAAGQVATISGGETNGAAGMRSAVGGGYSNNADGAYSTVAGGEGNRAAGSFSTVSGGSANTASGQFATVVGGRGSLASGDYSMAAGRRARALAVGCYVWADATGGDLVCGSPNAWMARASGGVYFYTDATHTSGVYLPAGSSAWSSVSDASRKENIRPVDGAEILSQLVALPIATWNYTTQDASIRHIGPMAQDFYAAFGVGESPLAISTVDADGVALAAIQGLYSKVQAQEKQLVAQQEKLAALEMRLAALESQCELGAPKPQTRLWAVGVAGIAVAGVWVLQRRNRGGG